MGSPVLGHTPVFTENTKIQLAFDIVRATVHQEIEITNNSYDEDSIIEGLKCGELATGMQRIIVVSTCESIAVVLSQEIDGEYEDYR
jgi:hypothetical protein